MTRISAVLVRHRLKFGLVLLVLCLMVLTVSVMRAVDYDRHMLAGDYAAASETKALKKLLQPDEDAPDPLGGKDTWDQTVALWVAQTATDSVDLSVGSRAYSMYNAGWAAYQDHNWEHARIYLQQAFAATCDASGNVRPELREFASNIQLLIGNVYANNQKDSEAIPCYEKSLTLNPNNICATYNLEKLQNAAKGGGSSGDQKKDGKGGAGSKKI